jgi:hypothetical protein
LPFSDLPGSTVAAVELALGAYNGRRRLDEVIKSLSVAPDDEAEQALGELARRFPALATEYEWIKAFIRRGTVTAIGMLLDRLAEPGLPDKRGSSDLWSVAQEIAALAQNLRGLTDELLGRFANAPGATRQVIEQALAKLGGSACVMALARDHAARNQPFDGLLHEAIRETALEREPIGRSSSTYELHPVAVTELRRELFAMLNGTPAEAAIGSACLNTIDELRDEFGPAGVEPRHPDIEAGRPWPMAV